MGAESFGGEAWFEVTVGQSADFAVKSTSEDDALKEVERFCEDNPIFKINPWFQPQINGSTLAPPEMTESYEGRLQRSGIYVQLWALREDNPGPTTTESKQVPGQQRFFY